MPHQTRAEFDIYWNYSAEPTQNPITGAWSIHGDVHLVTSTINGRIPSTFDTVTGRMFIGASNLTSLEGVPRHVGSLIANRNPLETLVHAPESCDHLVLYNCMMLNSLEHMPVLKSLKLTWLPRLHMLRCLTAQQVHVHYDANPALAAILQDVLNDPKWAGKGKHHMLNCALAMKKAGEAFVAKHGENPFVENARW